MTNSNSNESQANSINTPSEERYKLLVSNVRDYAIFLLDPNGTILTWNAGAEKLKGYTANEIIGKSFKTFYTDVDLARNHPEHELEVAKKTGRYEEEGWRVRKDGTTFWANVVITRLNDETGKLIGFAKITRDLSERRKAEQALRDSEERFRMASETLEKRVIERTKELRQAVESRDVFLSIASHELRTPLAILKLQHQLFERQISKTQNGMVPVEKVVEVSDLTIRQVNQLLRLVEDMLDVSRIATGRLRIDKLQGNLSDLVLTVFHTFATQFEDAHIKAESKIEKNIMANFDPHRIEQVIGNLISNSIKYGENSLVEISLRKVGDHAELAVTDQGKGISDEDQKRIFDRFERAVSANEVSGLGLGLFISRQIAEAHDGKISVESSPGNGTKFIVRLPLQ